MRHTLSTAKKMSPDTSTKQTNPGVSTLKGQNTNIPTGKPSSQKNTAKPATRLKKVSASQDNNATAQERQGKPLHVASQKTTPKISTVSPEQNNSRILQVLISLEKEVRQVESIKALQYLAVNETRKLVQARQIYMFEATLPGSDKFQVKAVSSITTPDRNLPVIQWFERMTKAMSEDVGSGQPNIFKIPTYCQDDQEIKTYPFGHMLWIPLKAHDGKVFSGMMLAREREWTEAESNIATQLAEIYAHAWSALLGRNRLSKPRKITSKLMLGTALAVFLAGFIPVSMNTLAPVEVVAQKPSIVAAPIDGVIEQIFVRPNSPVKKGQPLYQFVNTKLRNDYEVSKRAVTVAQAKYRKAIQGSFSSSEAKHDIATAKAELELKKAESLFAKENFQKSVVWSPEDGLAIFHSKEQWLGIPVKTGEKIMTVISGNRAEVRIDLPVSDAIVLKEKARVKVFLDSDPMNPIEAIMTHASYHATPTLDQQLAYRVHASFSKQNQTPPRIGLRGTAQIFGEKTTLFFYLFRRPIAAARQMFGI